jgi:hypothetical protein
MKKNSPFSLLFLLLFCSAISFNCNNSSDTPAPGTDQPLENSKKTGGFADDHKLSGRYINTANGIRSYTFKTDGTFAKGGAVSGEFRGGDYAAGSHDEGTYRLNGNTIQLTYTNGDKEDLPIEIYPPNDQNDYSLETPGQLKINNIVYVNVDE